MNCNFCGRKLNKPTKFGVCNNIAACYRRRGAQVLGKHRKRSATVEVGFTKTPTAPTTPTATNPATQPLRKMEKLCDYLHLDYNKQLAQLIVSWLHVKRIALFEE